MLTLIRHGRTKANREGRYLGKTDEDLSEEGKKEIMNYVEMHRYPQADQVYTSSMKRCKTTASLIYPEKEIQEIPEWNETDFGIFEGKNHVELDGIKSYQEWIDSGGKLPFPGGESREQFIARCIRGMEKMLNHLPENLKSAALVVHGGTIMALLSTYCGGDYFDYQVSNGSGFQVSLMRRQEEIVFDGIKRI